jgi:hypothetical protein
MVEDVSLVTWLEDVWPTAVCVVLEEEMVEDVWLVSWLVLVTPVFCRPGSA